jgi:hypothetical protein
VPTTFTFFVVEFYAQLPQKCPNMRIISMDDGMHMLERWPAWLCDAIDTKGSILRVQLLIISYCPVFEPWI